MSFTNTNDKMTKRAISTITVYVYGDTPQQQFDESKKMIDLLNDKFDCQASIEQMHTAPFGKIGASEKININNLNN